MSVKVELSADAVRKQFEAWWLARHPGSQFNDLKRTAKSGAYDKEWLNDCWLAWNAALQSAEQAICVGCGHSPHTSDCPEELCYCIVRAALATAPPEQAATVANVQLSTTELGSFDSVNTQPQPVSAGALSGPDGYAFRYPDGIRFTTGEAINGSRPLDSIPYYFESSLAAHDQKVRAEVLEEVDKKVRELPRFDIVEVLAAIRSLAAPAASKPEKEPNASRRQS